MPMTCDIMTTSHLATEGGYYSLSWLCWVAFFTSQGCTSGHIGPAATGVCYGLLGRTAPALRS